MFVSTETMGIVRANNGSLLMEHRAFIFNMKHCVRSKRSFVMEEQRHWRPLTGYLDSAANRRQELSMADLSKWQEASQPYRSGSRIRQLWSIALSTSCKALSTRAIVASSGPACLESTSPSIHRSHLSLLKPVQLLPPMALPKARRCCELTAAPSKFVGLGTTPWSPNDRSLTTLDHKRSAACTIQMQLIRSAARFFAMGSTVVSKVCPKVQRL